MLSYLYRTIVTSRACFMGRHILLNEPDYEAIVGQIAALIQCSDTRRIVKNTSLRASLRLKMTAMADILLTELLDHPTTAAPTTVEFTCRSADKTNLILSVDFLRQTPNSVLPLVVVRELCFRHEVSLSIQDMKSWSRFIDRFGTTMARDAIYLT